MEIIATITPVFVLILLGWTLRKRGVIPMEFLASANRLVYYIAIPALIFRSISKGSVGHHFNGTVLAITLGSAALVYVGAWVICRYHRITGPRAGSFIQSAGHGNLGYIGLAVSLYLLGDAGLVQTSIIAGFLMILQNALSVFFLQLQPVEGEPHLGLGPLLQKLFGNPVILSAMAGILFSAVPIPIPLVFQRSLDMLGGLAPPMALLLIGASLSLSGISQHIRWVTGAVILKLAILPGIGLALYAGFDVPTAVFLPGFILLACPTATVTYIMSKELRGDPEFVAATISASTLLSAVTFSLWLMLIQD